MMRSLIIIVVVIVASLLSIIVRADSASTLSHYPQCASSLLRDVTLSTSSSSSSVSFDYIVVGAGGSGSIVSYALASSLQSMSVLLIEAGKLTSSVDNPTIGDPALWLHVLQNDTLEWRFRSVPQRGLNGRVIELGFAKGTGGSVMHNGMAWVRGGHSWMDLWSSQCGCAGWNSTSMSAAFASAEGMLQPAIPGPDEQGVSDALFAAANQAGFPTNNHYNDGPELYGISHMQMTMNLINSSKANHQSSTSASNDDVLTFDHVGSTSSSGANPFTRVTSYSKYIASDDAAPSMSNLYKTTGYRALLIGFTDNVDAVDGVDATPQASYLTLFDEVNLCITNVSINANVGGGIILSAGTINSPALLQHSGIGNATLLTSLGIATVSDLPGVGLNLIDDVGLALIYNVPVETLDLSSPPAGGFFSPILFIPSNVSKSTQADGDVNLNTNSSPRSDSVPQTDIAYLFGSGKMIGQSFPSADLNSIIAFPNIQQLTARGTVTIASGTDLLTQPLIDPAYLESDSDVARAIDSVRQIRVMMTSAAMSPFNLTEVVPGAAIQSDDDIGNFARNTANTGYHLVGTNKMGDIRADPYAVVDPDSMAVYGIGQLYVVDASVAPLALSANTQALAMAIAVRGAELIINKQRQYQANKQDVTQRIAMIKQEEDINSNTQMEEMIAIE